MPDSSNNRIKNYLIVKKIGKGGMGEVYVAKHPTLKQEIILKKLSIRDREASERFLQEAKIMLEFRHENIVQIYDHFKEGSATYIAMEYVKGKSLNEIIQENENIPVPLALFILYQAALGLHHAHTKKVIHRDIKPHNILISSTTGNIKLTDFGISKKPGEEDKGLTQEGTVIGTPAYMAPEQFSSRGEASIQSDVYSLGIVFYEMITGSRPYRNEFSAEVISAITKGRFTPATKFVKNLPGIAKKILRKTFNPKMKRRFKNLLPLIHILRNYFRKYNAYEIKDSVRRLLLHDKKLMNAGFFISQKKQKIKSMIFRITVLSVIAIAILSYLFVASNTYYEFFAAKKYGKINVEFDRVNMNIDNIFVGIDGKYEKAYFRKDYLGYFRDVFRNMKNKKKVDLKLEDYIDKRYHNSFYLKEGEHDISISSGSYKNLKKVVVLPRILQDRNRNTKNGQTVFIPIVDLWPQEVSVYFRFWDSISQKWLFSFDNYSDKQISQIKNEETNLYVYYYGKWMTVIDFILMKKNRKEDTFKSGVTYTFLVKNFEKDDIKYADKRFVINFSLDDRTVVIHTPLTPQPGRIKIISNVAKIPVFINNETQGMVFNKGDYNYANYIDIKPVKYANAFYREILVPPSNYTVRISRKGKDINLNLKSGDEQTINVKFENGKYIY